jgi:hypothetical protein
MTNSSRKLARRGAVVPPPLSSASSRPTTRTGAPRNDLFTPGAAGAAAPRASRAATALPFHPTAPPADLAARRAEGLAWPVEVRDIHRQQHRGTVEAIEARLEHALATAAEPCTLEVAIGGSLPGYIVGLGDKRPGDRDDLCRIALKATPELLARHGGVLPRLDVEDIKRLVEPALARALEEVFGAEVPFVTDERRVPGGTLFRARIGLPHAHVDLRFLAADSDVRPYDYVCNSLYVDRRDLQAGEAPQLRTFSAAPLEEVLADLRRGRFSMDHGLGGDSLMRDWKMRSRGYVPNLPAPEDVATRRYFEALLPTLLTTLREQGKGEGMSLPYAAAEFVRRARALAGAGPTEPASRPALALVANAVVSLAMQGASGASADEAEAAQLLQNELRRQLDSCTRVAELGGVARRFVEQLHDDAHLGALTLWLHAVAAPEGDFDPRALPRRYEVTRVDTPGGASLRVFLPELRSYVVVPDSPAIAASAHPVLPDIRRLVAGPAPEAVREALAPVGRTPAFEALVPAGFWHDEAAQERAAERLLTQARGATAAPLAYRARLLLAAARLSQRPALPDALDALAAELSPEDGARVRALAHDHRVRRFAQLQETLRSGRAKPEERKRAWEQAFAILAVSPDPARARLVTQVWSTLAQPGLRVHVTEQEALRRGLEACDLRAVPEAAWDGVCALWANLSGASHPTTAALAESLAARVNARLEARTSLFEATAQTLADKKAFGALWRLRAEQPHLPLSGRLSLRLLVEAPEAVLHSDVGVTASLVEAIHASGIDASPLWADPKRLQALCGVSAWQGPMAALVNDATPPAAVVESLLQQVAPNRLGLNRWLDTLTPGGPVYLAGAAALLRTGAVRQDALTLAQRVWDDCMRADVPQDRLAGFLLEAFARLGGVARGASVELPEAVTDDSLVDWHLLIMNEPDAARGEPSLHIARWLLGRGEVYGAALVLMDVAPALRDNVPAYDAIMDAVVAVVGPLCDHPDERSLCLGVAEDLLDGAPRLRPAWQRPWQVSYAAVLFSAMEFGEREIARAAITRLLEERFDSTAAAQDSLQAFMSDADEDIDVVAIASSAAEIFSDPAFATPRVARLLSPVSRGDTPERTLSLAMARAAVAPLIKGEALHLALNEICAQPEAPQVLQAFLSARCAGGVDTQTCAAMTTLLEAYVQLPAAVDVRRRRLDEMCDWIGIPASGPVPKALAEGTPGREVALRLLVGVSRHLLGLAPSREEALRRLCLLVEELAITPGTTALLYDLSQHATAAGIAGSAGKIVRFALCLFEEHLRAGRLQAAQEVQAHLHFFLITGCRPDPKTKEEIGCRILQGAEAFAPEDRYASIDMASHLREVLRDGGAGAALSNAIAAARKSLGAAPVTSGKSHCQRLLDRELVEVIAHQVGPAAMADFNEGILNVLEAGGRLSGLSLPRLKRLQGALSEALKDPLCREKLRALWGTWAADGRRLAEAPKEQPTVNSPEAWRGVQLLAKALVAAGNVGSADVAAWLTICARRHASDGVQEWGGIARTVLDAASAAALAAGEESLEPVRLLLRRTRRWGKPLLRRLDDTVKTGR